jgi:hypothetical protein
LFLWIGKFAALDFYSAMSAGICPGNSECAWVFSAGTKVAVAQKILKIPFGNVFEGFF